MMRLFIMVTSFMIVIGQKQCGVLIFSCNVSKKFNFILSKSAQKFLILRLKISCILWVWSKIASWTSSFAFFRYSLSWDFSFSVRKWDSFITSCACSSRLLAFLKYHRCNLGFVYLFSKLTGWRILDNAPKIDKTNNGPKNLKTIMGWVKLRHLISPLREKDNTSNKDGKKRNHLCTRKITYT